MEKVLVGCPTADLRGYCLNRYLEGIKALTYKNVDALLVDNSKTNDYFELIKKKGFNAIKDRYQEPARRRVVSSRNILRKYALDNGYDYFLSLEQDVIPPKDVIERLLRHKKRIISGVYFQQKEDFQGKLVLQALLWKTMDKDVYERSVNDPVFKKYVEELTSRGLIDRNKEIWPQITQQLLPQEVETPRLMEAYMCGLGCVLIHKEVLKKITFRHADTKTSATDDYYFCMDAKESGFGIFADTSVKCIHLIKERKYSKEEDW